MPDSDAPFLHSTDGRRPLSPLGGLVELEGLVWSRRPEIRPMWCVLVFNRETSLWFSTPKMNRIDYKPLRKSIYQGEPGNPLKPQKPEYPNLAKREWHSFGVPPRPAEA